MDVNLAAAAEIARQLRLRDLGGIVIIDFIDLRKAQNRQALYDEMVKLMATDKAKHTVLPLTKFGLMQITRQRVRPVAVEEVSDVCPTCNGTGKIEPTVLLDKKIENQISFLTQDRDTSISSWWSAPMWLLSCGRASGRCAAAGSGNTNSACMSSKTRASASSRCITTTTRITT